MDFVTLDQPGSQRLPNSTAVLVLGILSIPACICCYGILSVVLGAIALVLANQDLAKYKQNPASFDRGQYNNLNAGRVCAIIGLCIGGLYLLLFLFALVFSLSFLPDSPLQFDTWD